MTKMRTKNRRPKRKNQEVRIIRTREDFLAASGFGPPRLRSPTYWALSVAEEAVRRGCPVTLSCGAFTWTVTVEEARDFLQWAEKMEHATRYR